MNSAVIVDNDRKSYIPDIVNAYFMGEVLDLDTLEPALFHYEAPSRMFHTRTLIKIQDGCDNLCTFCIIPSVRGRAKSRPPEQILEHVRSSIRTGTKEIVLTGVNITRYRYEDWDFYRLCEAILAVPGSFRVRVSSIEPEIDIPRMKDIVAHEKFCPHLHLCLQSGSNRILLQMRREYTIREFIRITVAMRSVDPLFNITSDVIVGFPGESNRDFSETLAIAKEIHFGHVHVFPYSKRSGTRAERFSNTVDVHEKKTRMEQALALSKALSEQYRKKFIGKTMQVLTEEARLIDRQHHTYGLNSYYVPVITPSEHAVNTFVALTGTDICKTGELHASIPAAGSLDQTLKHNSIRI